MVAARRGLKPRQPLLQAGQPGRVGGGRDQLLHPPDLGLDGDQPHRLALGLLRQRARLRS